MGLASSAPIAAIHTSGFSPHLLTSDFLTNFLTQFDKEHLLSNLSTNFVLIQFVLTLVFSAYRGTSYGTFERSFSYRSLDIAGEIPCVSQHAEELYSIVTLSLYFHSFWEDTAPCEFLSPISPARNWPDLSPH